MNVREYDGVKVYREIGIGCSFDITVDYDNMEGILDRWSISYNGETHQDSDKDKFVELLNKMIDGFELKQISKKKKDVIVIYIDELNKIRGFFKDIITKDFNLSVEVLNFIEFRDISAWNKELHKSQDIAKHAQFLFDNIFIPEGRVYITPNQRPRKHLQYAAKSLKDETAKNLFPEPSQYRFLRMGLFGGICYCPYPNYIIEDQMIEIDLDSAYIFDFLVEKHCMSEFINVDVNQWEYYLSSKTKTSIGMYKITYSCWTNKVRCFKDIDGNTCEQGENTSTFIMNNIDLLSFLTLVDAKEIECLLLRECKLDYLPKYVRDIMVEEYIKKEELKQTKGSDDPETILQKVCVNGIYGDSIRKYEDTLDIKRAKSNAALTPQWGIWTTSYCKKYLLKLGLKVDGWYYSDTDSIYCLDTPENRKLIEEFNNEIQNKTKEYCELFGYDYDKLKKLGTFQIKNKILKFKAITNKIYMYKTEDNMILKAAGSSKDTVDIDDSLFELDKVPVGNKAFGFLTDKSYFELIWSDDLAEAAMEYFVKANAKSQK